MNELNRNHKKRMSGILAHPTSFPSKYGIGDLGQCAYDFIDFMFSAGQTLWQVLPVGPTGYGDSPYQSFSAFAGQTLMISPDLLCTDHLLGEDDLKVLPTGYQDMIDYGQVIYYKTQLFNKAYSNFTMLGGSHSFTAAFKNFCTEHAFWLDDYALYTAIKESNQGKPWMDWPEDQQIPTPEIKQIYSDKLKGSINYTKFLQFLFYKQWFELKQYANDKNIFIVGDIPIFVAMDGCDTWANQELFKLDSKGFPLAVSGVPPDYFSNTGQLWGNPLYNWEVLKNNNYSWWISRIKHQLHLVDYLRIDHFRGFEAYWSVPYGEKTAVNGHWEKGPYLDFFYTLQHELGDNLPIFAEDLGVITPEVENMRDTFNFPGMKILHLAFEDIDDNYFLPHNYPHNCICYTGTHDNNTTAGWYETVREESKDKVKLYTNSQCTDVSWDFIRLALGSAADYAIIPIQDILSLGAEGRMNIPGTPSGNWTWRFLEDSLNNNTADRLRVLTQLYGR